MPLASMSDSRPKAVVSISYMLGAVPATPPSKSMPSVSMSSWMKPPGGTTSSRKMAPLGPTYLAVATTVVKDEHEVVAQMRKVSFTPTTGGPRWTGGAAAHASARATPASVRSRARSIAWNSAAVPWRPPRRDQRRLQRRRRRHRGGRRAQPLQRVLDRDARRGLIGCRGHRREHVLRPAGAGRRQPQASVGEVGIEDAELADVHHGRRRPRAAAQRGDGRRVRGVRTAGREQAGEDGQREREAAICVRHG